MKSLLFLCLLSSAAFARIGETPQQCEARYGKPTIMHPARDTERVRFSVGQILITCWFWEGKCCSIDYEIGKPSNVVYPKDITAERFELSQAQRFLKFNSAGGEWVHEQPEEYGKPFDGVYKTKDGKLQALVNFTGVTIETTDWHALNVKQAEAAEIEKVIDAITR